MIMLVAAAVHIGKKVNPGGQQTNRPAPPAHGNRLTPPGPSPDRTAAQLELQQRS